MTSHSSAFSLGCIKFDLQGSQYRVSIWKLLKCQFFSIEAESSRISAFSLLETLALNKIFLSYKKFNVTLYYFGYHQDSPFKNLCFVACQDIRLNHGVTRYRLIWYRRNGCFEQTLNLYCASFNFEKRELFMASSGQPETFKVKDFLAFNLFH